MKIVALTFVIYFLTSVFAPIASADTGYTYEKETKHLKTYIVESPCIFTRNGINYKGSEAVTHINRKEKYFKEKIVTAEDFIRLSATKSETSGINYTVTCTTDNTVALGPWLLDELVKFRKRRA